MSETCTTTPNDPFNHDVALFYERHMVPMIFEPYADYLVDYNFKPNDLGAALETAAGTGIVTRKLALHPSTWRSLVATDLSSAMLELAKTLCPETEITWRQADAANLPFPEEMFDTVICQFGFMFLEDKIKAFREAGRVLRPGGRLIFSVWDRIEENDFAQTVSSALGAIFPTDPPDFLARVPHGYHDIPMIASDLAMAGFDYPTSFRTIRLHSQAANARTPALALVQGTPLRRQIEGRGSDLLDEATDAAERALLERFGAGAIRGNMQAHIILADRPGARPGS